MANPLGMTYTDLLTARQKAPSTGYGPAPSSLPGSMPSPPSNALGAAYPLTGSSLAPDIQAGKVQVTEPDEEGDLDEIIKDAMKSPTNKGNSKISAALRTAYASSRNNPISALGFNPTRIAVDPGTAETNIAGEYSPEKDFIYSTLLHPESIVHESTHRGLTLLQNSGVLSDEENKLINEVGQEPIVRWIMAKNMGDPDTNNGDVSATQRGEGIYNFGNDFSSWGPKQQKLLNSIELKASRQLALHQLRDAKAIPNNVDAQIQAMLAAQTTGFGEAK
jgi:hypothetical protein